MASVRNPSLYQINTLAWFREQVAPAQPLPLLAAGGLFLDIAPWQAHVFDVLAT